MPPLLDAYQAHGPKFSELQRHGLPARDCLVSQPARLEEGRTGRNSVNFYLQFALVMPRPELLGFIRQQPCRPGPATARVCSFAREGFSEWQREFAV